MKDGRRGVVVGGQEEEGGRASQKSERQLARTCRRLPSRLFFKQTLFFQVDSDLRCYLA